MKGKDDGVQRKILDINHRAFFVPSSDHTLKFVVNDTTSTDVVGSN